MPLVRSSQESPPSALKYRPWPWMPANRLPLFGSHSSELTCLPASWWPAACHGADSPARSTMATPSMVPTSSLVTGSDWWSTFLPLGDRQTGAMAGLLWSKVPTSLSDSAALEQGADLGGGVSQLAEDGVIVRAEPRRRSHGRLEHRGDRSGGKGHRTQPGEIDLPQEPARRELRILRQLQRRRDRGGGDVALLRLNHQLLLGEALGPLGQPVQDEVALLEALALVGQRWIGRQLGVLHPVHQPGPALRAVR